MADDNNDLDPKNIVQEFTKAPPASIQNQISNTNFMVTGSSNTSELRNKAIGIQEAEWVRSVKNKTIANVGDNRVTRGYGYIYDNLFSGIQIAEGLIKGKVLVTPEESQKNASAMANALRRIDASNQINKQASDRISNDIIMQGTENGELSTETEEEATKAKQRGIAEIEKELGKPFEVIYGEFLDKVKSESINNSILDTGTWRWLTNPSEEKTTPIASFLIKNKKNLTDFFQRLRSEAQNNIALADAYGDAGWVSRLTSDFIGGTAGLATDAISLAGFDILANTLGSVANSTLGKHALIGSGFASYSVIANWVNSEDYSLEQASLDFLGNLAMYVAPMGIASGVGYGLKKGAIGFKALKDLAIKPVPNKNLTYAEILENSWEFKAEKAKVDEYAEKGGVNSTITDKDFPDTRVYNPVTEKVEPVLKVHPAVESNPVILERTGTKLNAEGNDFETVNGKKIDQTISRTTSEIAESLSEIVETANKEVAEDIKNSPDLAQTLQKYGKGIGRIDANTHAMVDYITTPLIEQRIKDPKNFNLFIKKLEPTSKKHYDHQLAKEFGKLIQIGYDDGTVNIPEQFKDIALAYLSAMDRNFTNQTHGGQRPIEKLQGYSLVPFSKEKIDSPGAGSKFNRDAEAMFDWKRMEKRKIEELENDIARKQKSLEKEKDQEVVKNLKKEISSTTEEVKKLKKKGYTKAKRKSIAIGIYEKNVEEVHGAYTIVGLASKMNRKEMLIKSDKYATFLQNWGDDVNIAKMLHNKIEKDVLQTAIFNEFGFDPVGRIDLILKATRRIKEKGVIAKYLPSNYYKLLELAKEAFEAERKIPDEPNWLENSLSLGGATAQAVQLRNIFRFAAIEEPFRISKIKRPFGKLPNEDGFSFIKGYFADATPEQRAILADMYDLGGSGRRDSINDWLVDSTRGILPEIFTDILSLGARPVTNANKRSTKLFFGNTVHKFLQKDITKLTQAELKDLETLGITKKMLEFGKQHLEEATFTLKTLGGGEAKIASFAEVYAKYIDEGNVKNADLAMQWMTASKRAVQVVIPESSSFREMVERGNPGSDKILTTLLKYNPILHLTGAARQISRQIADMNGPEFYSFKNLKALKKFGDAMWEWYNTNLMIGMAIDHLKQAAQGDKTDSQVMYNHFLNADYGKLMNRALNSHVHAQMMGGMAGFFGEIATMLTVLFAGLVANPGKSPKQIARENHLVGEFANPTTEAILKTLMLPQIASQLVTGDIPGASVTAKNFLSIRGDWMGSGALDLAGYVGNRYILQKILGDIDENAMVQAILSSGVAQAIQENKIKQENTRQKAVNEGRLNPKISEQR